MTRRLCDSFRYKARIYRAVIYRAMIVLLSMELGYSAAALGQEPSVYNRSTAIDRADSRAEHEAEQLVSLSADKILSILREEPGLLLQVKKALVRSAFEQGRILDPKDLTDDAVFRLIVEDDNIRNYRDSGN